MLLVNFKTYQSATGKRAVHLARVCSKIAREKNIQIVPVVQTADLFRVVQEVQITVYAQHIDPVIYGANTGQTLPEGVRECGASGTLLNHAEKQIDLETIARSIKRARDVGLATVVCINTEEIAAQIAVLEPDYIAIEPPELIGGTISVSSAKPEVIRSTVSRVGNIPVLCGAGIKTAEDIRKALEYGAKGVLLASGVTNAENPEAYLRSLVKGFSD